MSELLGNEANRMPRMYPDCLTREEVETMLQKLTPKEIAYIAVIQLDATLNAAKKEFKATQRCVATQG